MAAVDAWTPREMPGDISKEGGLFHLGESAIARVRSARPTVRGLSHRPPARWPSTTRHRHAAHQQRRRIAELGLRSGLVLVLVLVHVLVLVLVLVESVSDVLRPYRPYRAPGRPLAQHRISGPRLLGCRTCPARVCVARRTTQARSHVDCTQHRRRFCQALTDPIGVGITRSLAAPPWNALPFSTLLVC
jgi:hypothetical protein